MQENTTKSTKSVEPTFSFELPDTKLFLKAGVQFGHQAKKWNPKMKKYIFSKKDGIHVIDISKTIPALSKAMEFLAQASSKGNILIVGTKRQASEIIKKYAIESGSYYVTHRWPGGLFTNFDMIKQSLKRYKDLEQELSKGVEDRTKFEITQMKKEWEKMNRLYEGIKTLDNYPTAIIVIDSNYEKNAIKEAHDKNIPVIGIIDTNCDPDIIDIAVPANDDAIGSIELIVSLFAQAIKKGNKGNGVEHKLQDFSKQEVTIIKSKKEIADEKKELASELKPVEVKKITVVKTKPSKSYESKGLLEGIQKSKEIKKQSKAVNSRA